MTKPSTGRTIVVAVDFGTTFSGVAWAQTSNPESHYIINQWPQNTSGSSDGMTSEKVPSEVTYEYSNSGPKCLWGFQIIDSMPRIQWIKLGLAPDQKLGVGSRLSSTYSDCHRIPVLYHSSAENVVTDYLRSLREHAVSILRSKLGNSLDSTNLEFVITVPAIWPDRAKMATLTCAEKAGFGESSAIRIISEPEAAAIHSLRASSPHGLEIGDTIVLCDAGGGTVDLITFTIVELLPNLRLKEEAPGTGSLCGSTFLNRRFEDLLNERLSSLPGWGRDTLYEAMQHFETVAKRTFSGNVDDDFMFPVPGIADSEAAGVRRGRLRVSGQGMQQLFQPILQDIETLVREQIEASAAKVKAIFLVGGFGQSPYLRKHLRDCFSPAVQVTAPVDGWTAVVRGALEKTLGYVSPLAANPSVDSRKARKTYGMIMSTEYIEDFHDENRNDYHGSYRISVMHWFIRKGDEIKEAEPITTEWQRHQLATNGSYNCLQVRFYELNTGNCEQPPLYLNRHMKKHAILNPVLSKVQKKRISKSQGKDGEKYYQVAFKIDAAYFSAHCEYTLWYEERNYGSIKVDYLGDWGASNHCFMETLEFTFDLSYWITIRSHTFRTGAGNWSGGGDAGRILDQLRWLPLLPCFVFCIW
ncbi:actin-like ATPase domain-containing protein [Aspergillus sclerotioniger CBS 115572]|uniref:Actin-like ATPase domain-containing protein n=1 Tax=Aspergillus sclerotioniger CBS 115572 TaxID=1450535 RepID=A0A317VNY6_9EURO|nr:actin-like ATPase domain-containing protein [Aspergillus sclerotioniger CBS 115572]PWY74562.1 actin-like ATPase domain-containing protein [Aspergillus sclerotioniger CBS 115572]